MGTKASRWVKKGRQPPRTRQQFKKTIKLRYKEGKLKFAVSKKYNYIVSNIKKYHENIRNK
jgi:hypothetical protein